MSLEVNQETGTEPTTQSNRIKRRRRHSEELASDLVTALVYERQNTICVFVENVMLLYMIV